MKIVGIGTLTPDGGTVVSIQRDKVEVVRNGKRVVYTFAKVEELFHV